MLAIRHLADRVAQHVFADLGTFMLDRTVKSFISADKMLVQGALGHPALKTIARDERRCAEKMAALIHLEDRLTRSAEATEAVFQKIILNQAVS